jgi:hypothetical protein
MLGGIWEIVSSRPGFPASAGNLIVAPTWEDEVFGKDNGDLVAQRQDLGVFVPVAHWKEPQ